MTGGHPDHFFGIMIDNSGHVFMPFSVDGFVNANLFEPVEMAFKADIQIGTDAADNWAD